jgi:hypothetical protein
MVGLSIPLETRILFGKLVDQWRRDTRMRSAADVMIMHPAYQQIIGLGPAAVPLLLEELSTRPNHWFWALKAITREDPAQGITAFEEAVGAWLQWGRDHGYS